MRNFCLILVLIYASLPVNPAHSVALFSKETCEDFQRIFPRIRIEASQRSGFGDVAAAYLSALTLIKECPPLEKIQIRLDSYTSRAALTHLSKDQPDFDSLVRVLVNEQQGPLPDLIVYPASFDGDIPINERITESVVIRAPVFSDSESSKGYGTVTYKDLKFKSGVPGVGKDQLGIYPDPVAESFKNLSRTQIIDRLNQTLIDFDMDTLTKILVSSRNLGLVYGVSNFQTDYFLQAYLKGLKKKSRNGPVVLLSPSRILDSLDRMSQNKKMDGEFLKNIETIHLKDLEGEWKPRSNGIYVIETPNLPNSIFVGLMALSVANDIVPLGAGDGFLSSAIAMGIPFGLTQVSHNSKVISDFHSHFFEWASLNLPSGRAAQVHNALLKNFRPQGRDHQAHIDVQSMISLKEEFSKFSNGVGTALES